MKILYNILNPTALGADRWMWEGYRGAFTALGHEVFTVTENDDFETVAKEAQPDFLFLDFHQFMDYCRRVREVSPEFLKELKNGGAKILCMTAFGLDKEEDTPEKDAFFRKYLPHIDACFSQFTPEKTADFERIYGKKMHFVPHAADARWFFPDEPREKFRCDIAFVGSFYTQKRAQFETLLLPLFKKYDVRVYGSGWTLWSKFLRAAGGAARRLKLARLTKLINSRRLLLSPDDERRLYASAKICVNIHEYYRDGTTKGFSNEREMKIPASGGFEITDYIPGMERYFELGREIVAVRSPQEWFEKIAYYLDPAHEAEREQIRQAGAARVHREHTYAHRAKQLLEVYHSL